MRVLILYERSGVVRDAFIRRGHDAWSVDLEPSEDCSLFHIQGDVREVWDRVRGWGIDLLIAHPPCTDLSVSGALHFKAKIADGRQQKAIDEFMWVAGLPVPMKAVENPIGIMSTRWRKPDQIIQPYEFGHDASKKTCLWLEGLAPLKLDPALYVPPRIIDGRKRWGNQTDSGQNRLGPSLHRAMDRARTYQGIADAMAEQFPSQRIHNREPLFDIG